MKHFANGIYLWKLLYLFIISIQFLRKRKTSSKLQKAYEIRFWIRSSERLGKKTSYLICVKMVDSTERCFCVCLSLFYRSFNSDCYQGIANLIPLSAILSSSTSWSIFSMEDSLAIDNAGVPWSSCNRSRLRKHCWVVACSSGSHLNRETVRWCRQSERIGRNRTKSVKNSPHCRTNHVW